MPGTPEFQQRLESIEKLIRQIEAAADPNVRTAAREMVQLVMELHGSALERILEIVHSSREGQAILDSLGGDDMVSSILVLYGLHPLSVEERVEQAIEKANRQMRGGSSVELAGIEDGVVRVRLHAKGNVQALKEQVEAAIYQAAPDIVSLHMEGADDKQGFVPLEMLLGVPPARPSVNGHAAENPGNIRP